jgi:DnaJ homolog subfamily C member 9
MGLLFQCVMLSDPSEDSHRYMDMINEAIANAEVERYDQYSTWAKRMAKRRRPQPKETKRKSKDNDQKQEKKSKASKADAEAELAALILQRQKARGEDSLEQAMAAKYGVDLSDMPNEEEFEAARARLVRSKAERKESSRAKKPKT